MKLFLVELEPVETRYTAQWKVHLPVQLRNAGFDVEVAFGVDFVVVAWAGAADVVAGDKCPLEAFIDKDIDEVAGVGHFCGEEAFGVVGEVGVSAPGFPPGVFEGLDFLAEN